MSQVQPSQGTQQGTQNAGSNNLPRVVWCEPIPDRKFTDQYGNPQRWILRVKDGRDRGKVVFPLGFTVDPQVKEYPVEVVVEKPRYLVGKLHTRHVHGEQCCGCCTFRCALCGELFEDCGHPLARQCLEELRREKEKEEGFREGLEYIAARVRESMPDVVEDLNEAIEWFDSGIRTRELAERLYRVLSILPVKCYERYYSKYRSEYICTDGSHFLYDTYDDLGINEPGYVFRLVEKLTPFMLRAIQWFIRDELDVNVEYYVTIKEQ